MFLDTHQYVDDLNLVGTLEELTRTSKYLKKEFEMKDLRITKFCKGLQIKHFPTGVLVHQSTYIKKILKHFYMDKTHFLSSPMVFHLLNMKNDPFRHYENGEELLGPKVPYLSAISALMYLANCTWNILFFLSIYLVGTVPLQPKDIGMVSSIYYVTSKEQLI